MRWDHSNSRCFTNYWIHGKFKNIIIDYEISANGNVEHDISDRCLLYIGSVTKSHCHWYPCPANLNYLWNIGFLLISALVQQIVSGFLLSLHYTSDIVHSYSSVIHIIQDIYYGWYFHYLHSIGASFVLVVMYLHISRSLYIGSFLYNGKLWLSGVCLMIFLMLVAFLGYVLVWGQMSYWGSTVITNLWIWIPCLVECICGGFYVSNPTLQRFFVFHIIVAFLICALIIIHLYYLHGQW
jgi:ubiquinol-cytochrome c reductase cytochrome b subunit